MDSQNVSEHEHEGMRLRVAFIHWAACLGVFILLVVLASVFESSIFGNLAFFFYFVVGFYLNRAVLRKIVEWHPMHNTLGNITSEKLKFFLLWPITYLFLFISLGVNKVL